MYRVENAGSPKTNVRCFSKYMDNRKKIRLKSSQEFCHNGINQLMCDIFISYSSADRERIKPLVRILEGKGWSVWWDRDIQIGKTFDNAIEEAIDVSKCVVVVWTKSSVLSNWVRNEAIEGERRGILIPIILDEVEIPLAFRRIEAAKLTDWDGISSDHPEILNLFEAITRNLGKHPNERESTQNQRAINSINIAPILAAERANTNQPRRYVSKWIWASAVIFIIFVLVNVLDNQIGLLNSFLPTPSEEFVETQENEILIGVTQKDIWIKNACYEDHRSVGFVEQGSLVQVHPIPARKDELDRECVLIEYGTDTTLTGWSLASDLLILDETIARNTIARINRRIWVRNGCYEENTAIGYIDQNTLVVVHMDLVKFDDFNRECVLVESESVTGWVLSDDLSEP